MHIYLTPPDIKVHMILMICTLITHMVDKEFISIYFLVDLTLGYFVSVNTNTLPYTVEKIDPQKYIV